jgi:type II secretory pathway component PulC
MLKNKTIRSFFGVVLLLIAVPGAFAASEILYDSGNRRDPFVPLDGGENVLVSAASSGVRLEGIIYDPGEHSMAILNGKSYQKGDVMGDATVVKIWKDHVVISVEGEEKTLWIREEEKT